MTVRNNRVFVITAFAGLAIGCDHHESTSAPPRAEPTVGSHADADASANTNANANANTNTNAGSDAGAAPAVETAGADGGATGDGGEVRLGGADSGGTGEGTIGMGALGTIGGGGRMGTGDGYGTGAGGGRMGGRSNSGPMVRAAPPTVQGPMSPEVVRRIVLRNLGQVAHCHEAGLAQNPQLEGRVVVRFLIGANGEVTSSAVAESNVAVPTVGTCIAAAARRWQFPAMGDAGVTTVSYPFNLQHPE